LARRPPLGGLRFGLLKTLQEINGALRVGGCSEDGALVVLQDLQPRSLCCG
jgi:hypothetical protein